MGIQQTGFSASEGVGSVQVCVVIEAGALEDREVEVRVFTTGLTVDEGVCQAASALLVYR